MYEEVHSISHPYIHLRTLGAHFISSYTKVQIVYVCVGGQSNWKKVFFFKENFAIFEVKVSLVTFSIVILLLIMQASKLNIWTKFFQTWIIVESRFYCFNEFDLNRWSLLICYSIKCNKCNEVILWLEPSCPLKNTINS